MPRPKSTTKVKEPVKLRKRKLKNGNTSLYLDIYQKGVRRYEYLNLYLVPESSPLDRTVNKQTLATAEKIKAERIIGLRQYSVRQWDKVKRSAMTLVDWLHKYEQEQFGFSQSTLKGRRDMRLKVEAFLQESGQPQLAMASVDSEWCRDFIAWLGRSTHAVRKKNPGTISNGCAHHHQAVLNGAFNKAVREGIIKINPLKQLASKEKYQPTETMREYLTLSELKAVMDAECPHADVKKAFLLGCFTGLRLSDIRALTWSHIVKAPDGKTLYVRTRMKKTKRLLDIPLSDEGLACLNEKENPQEPIFLLPSNSNIGLNIKKLMDNAGVVKHITFHCARHTFATMLLTLGTDIYTTSKLLGHSNLSTTTIYAKIVDQKKIETVDRLNTFFAKQKETK